MPVFKGACTLSHRISNLRSLLNAFDAAMYEAKNGGRNRVACYRNACMAAANRASFKVDGFVLLFSVTRASSAIDAACTSRLASTTRSCASASSERGFPFVILPPVHVMLISVSTSTTVSHAGSSRRERREIRDTCGSLALGAAALAGFAIPKLGERRAPAVHRIGSTPNSGLHDRAPIPI